MKLSVIGLAWNLGKGDGCFSGGGGEGGEALTGGAHGEGGGGELHVKWIGFKSP